MWGYPRFVLGAIGSFLEPFCGHLSPKIDKVSVELTLRYPHEEPWVEHHLDRPAQLLERSLQLLRVLDGVWEIQLVRVPRHRHNQRALRPAACRLGPFLWQENCQNILSILIYLGWCVSRDHAVQGLSPPDPNREKHLVSRFRPVLPLRRLGISRTERERERDLTHSTPPFTRASLARDSRDC